MARAAERGSLRRQSRRAPAARSVRAGSELAVPYEVDGRQETLLYLRDPGDMAAYEELRAGFTAAVSHELRTPLARLLALLKSAALPGADKDGLIEQAQTEVDQIRELIDDVLFLSELETGREVVGLGSTPALPILREVAESAEQQRASGRDRRGRRRRGRRAPAAAAHDPRARANLVENAIRYAGPGARLELSVGDGSEVILAASDDGTGVRRGRDCRASSNASTGPIAPASPRDRPRASRS